MVADNSLSVTCHGIFAAFNNYAKAVLLNFSMCRAQLFLYKCLINYLLLSHSFLEILASSSIFESRSSRISSPCGFGITKVKEPFLMKGCFLPEKGPSNPKLFRKRLISSLRLIGFNVFTCPGRIFLPLCI